MFYLFYDRSVSGEPEVDQGLPKTDGRKSSWKNRAKRDPRGTAVAKATTVASPALVTFIGSTLQKGSALLQLHKPVNGHEVVVHPGDLALLGLPGGAWGDTEEETSHKGAREIRSLNAAAPTWSLTGPRYSLRFRGIKH